MKGHSIGYISLCTFGAVSFLSFREVLEPDLDFTEDLLAFDLIEDLLELFAIPVVEFAPSTSVSFGSD